MKLVGTGTYERGGPRGSFLGAQVDGSVGQVCPALHSGRIHYVHGLPDQVGEGRGGGRGHKLELASPHISPNSKQVKTIVSGQYNNFSSTGTQCCRSGSKLDLHS